VDMVFLLISMIGLVYFCVLLLSRYRASNWHSEMRTRLFGDERLHQLLSDAGLGWKAAHVQAIRFGVAAVYPLYTYVTKVLLHEPFTVAPVMVAMLWLLGTSPARISPLGLLVHARKKHVAAKRDSEWIAFLRLYENNHRNKQRSLQFSAFCEQIAPYLPHLRHDLLVLSQRVTVDGMEKAFEWLESRFPVHHPFIHEVFAIVQTTERLGSEEAVRFLYENSRVLTKLSSDQYERRWKTIGQWLNVLNTVPSMATFLMMVVLILLYVSMIKSQVAP
jgi:hypothetical protein